MCDPDHGPMDVEKATPHETVPLEKQSDIENDRLETKCAIIVAAILSILLILLVYLNTGTGSAAVAECYSPICHSHRYTVPGSDIWCETVSNIQTLHITVTVTLTVTVTETPTPILTKYHIPTIVTGTH